MLPGRIFLVTGSPADAARCDALCRKIRAHNLPVEPLIGRDGLAGVARVLQHAEMLVSVNTGIMHLGAILGVPYESPSTAQPPHFVGDQWDRTSRTSARRMVAEASSIWDLSIAATSLT